ncbi:MAG: glycosyltransferase family 4 protein [Gammaproteobacteria bacterium]|nr:glycosyltransferase family 4 protein [Gammaproteobacteria bacterium]
MRIWIVHQHAIPPIGMGPTRHFDLAKKLIEQGHEVYIFAGNYCHNSFHYIGEPYSVTKKIAYYFKVPFIWIDVPAYTKNSIKRLYNMLAFAFRLLTNKDLKFLPKPDIVLGSSPSPFAAWAAQRLASRYGVPFIYEIRDLWPETLLALGSFSKHHPLAKILAGIENFLLSKAVKIISVLPGASDYLLNKKIPKDKIKWLPNAVDLNHISYSPSTIKNEITIFYAGAFNVSNDIETLLKAAKIVQEEANHFQFKLIGEGPQRALLEKFVASEKINNVEFFPSVGKDQIYPILGTADICVGMVRKTNLYRFGTSLNKITDYLAIARPVVFALDSPYSPITEANAGLTVPPENPHLLAQAILKIGSLSPQEREQLGRNGRKYAEQYYNLDKITAEFIDCCKSE